MAMINSKLETLNSKQTQNIQYSKPYNLGERTFIFAKRVFNYVNSLPKTIANIEIAKQLIRSSGSIGANYIEAEEALSKKDFIMRIKISRKEAKESIYWLRLVQVCEHNEWEKTDLVRESTELMKIFGSIIEKSK
jgi:four helix bundle protein